MISVVTAFPSTFRLHLATLVILTTTLLGFLFLPPAHAAPEPWSDLRILGLWDADDLRSTVHQSQMADLEGKVLLGHGKTGRGYSFDSGPSALIPRNQGLYEFSHDVTFAAWVRPIAASNHTLTVMGKWISTNTRAGLVLDLVPLSSGFTLRGRIGSRDISKRTLTAGHLNPAEWNHVALTHDADHGITRLFLNACELASLTNQEPIYSSQALFMIAGVFNDRIQGAFHGDLDDVVIADQPLNSAGLQKLMSAPRSLSSFPPLNHRTDRPAGRREVSLSDSSTLFFSFQPASRWLAAILAGAGLALALIRIQPPASSGPPSAWTTRWRRTRRAWTACLACAALGLVTLWSLLRPSDWTAHWNANSLITQDQSLHRVRLAHDARLEHGFSDLSAVFNGKGSVAVLDGWAPSLEWTLEAWVRPDQTEGEFQLIAGGPTETANYGIALKSGQWAAIHSGPNKTRAFLVSTQSPPSIHQWHHVAASYDGREISLHVNGREIARAPSEPFRSPADITEMHIGCGQKWHSPDHKISTGSFQGAVDQVFLYHRALERSELQQLHRSSLWPQFPRELIADLFFSAALALFLLGFLLLIPHLLHAENTEAAPSDSDPLATPLATHPNVKSQFQPFRILVVILVTGLTLSFTAYRFEQRQMQARDINRFQTQIESFLEQFDTRTEHYVQHLLAARNWVNACENLTPAQWQSLILSLQIKRDYPGLFSLSYAPWIASDSVDAFEAWAQKNIHPAYALHPVPPELNRPAISTRHFGAGRPRLPLLYEYFNEAPEQENVQRTSAWGQDWAGIDARLESMENSDLNAIRVACDRDEVHCGGSEVFYPRTRRSPEVKGTTLYLGVVQWQEQSLAQDSPSTPPTNAARRPRGMLRARFDWNAFFESWLGDHPPEFSFKLLSPNRNLLCSFPQSREKAAEPQSSLHLTYQSRFYSRRLHFQFQALPSFFLDSHRQWPWLVLLLGTILTTGTSCLLWIQIRARLHQQSIAAQLQTTNEQLQSFVKDRERISRDLHDGTIQNIYAIGLGLKRCQALVDQNPAQAKQRLAETASHLSATIAELRQFILSLEPDLRSSENIKTALESLVARFQRTTSAHIDLQIDPDAAEGISSTHAVHLLNIIREALSNSLRHSSATRVTIQLQKREACRILIVRDNGQGFDSQSASESGRGLTNMEKRARELSGELNVITSPQQGTTVSILIPS